MLSMPRIVRPDLSGGEPDRNWFPHKIDNRSIH